MSQGSIYQRGNIFWIQYYDGRRKIRESSHSAIEADARRLLNKRLGEVAEGKVPGFYFDRVRYDELIKDLRTDYRVNGRKSTERLEASIKHLDKFFKGYRVVEITPSAVSEYVEKRLEEEAAPGTINRELTALKRALNLGRANGKVANVPYITMLAEHNVRQGFFEDAQFRALLEALPSYLRAPVTFAASTGMRKREVFSLTWDKVNLKAGYIRLEAADTKNEQPRTIYLLGEALAAVRTAHSRRVLGCPLVFHRGGKPVRDFRYVWGKACEASGCPGMVFHDLRRTAVRNMVRAGIPERVAMQISGHKTRAVFDRYNIVSDRDLREAAERIAAYQQAQSSTF
ncbi:MAG: tyrosine-type recombinase/integrase [Actinomycetota bacterium]